MDRARQSAGPAQRLTHIAAGINTGADHRDLRGVRSPPTAYYAIQGGSLIYMVPYKTLNREMQRRPSKKLLGLRA